MRGKFYRSLSFILAVLLLFSSVELPAHAAQADVSGGGVVSEELIEEAASEESIAEEPAVEKFAEEPDFSEAASENDIDVTSGDEAPSIPPLNYRSLTEERNYESILEHRPVSEIDRNMAVDLPKKYNPLESKKYLPPTRDQNPYGTCWAHAILAAGEIYLTKNKGIDPSKINLSELQLAYFMYNSPSTDPLGLVQGDCNYLSGKEDFLEWGGNDSFAKKIMQGWITAADDKGVLAYKNAANVRRNGLKEEYAFLNSYHMQNYRNVAIDVNHLEEAKQAIMEYGSLAVNYLDYGSYAKDNDDYTDANYYYPYETENSNHAVVIVGWDDNYSAKKFAKKPPKNGAWLIRNSWSTDPSRKYSRYTYFWMSYYDGSLTDGIAFAFEPADNYDNNYHYDASAEDATMSLANGDKIANVFQAQQAAETLEAVAFETYQTNMSYTVSVYKNLTDPENPESGTMSSTVSGMTDYSGYYTIPLKTPVSLKRGETFSVVVQLSLSGEDSITVGYERSANFFDYETGIDVLGSKAYSCPGESFCYRRNIWMDLYSYGEGNLRIKAFTKNVRAAEAETVKVTGLAFEKEVYSTFFPDQLKLTCTLLPANATNQKLKWTCSDTQIATVSYGRLVPLYAGEVTVTATSEDNPSLSASCKVKILPHIKIGRITTYTDDKQEAYLTEWAGRGLQVGRRFDLTAEFDPQGAFSGYHLVWESSNPEVIAISSDNATAMPLSSGEATLTVRVAEEPEINAKILARVNALQTPVSTCEPTGDPYKVRLRWTEVPGADEYILNVYYRDEDNYVHLLAIVPITGTEYIIENLTADSSDYSYILQAWKKDYSAGSSTGGYFSVGSEHGRSHKVHYVLNGGTNHALNPERVWEDDRSNPPLRSPVFSNAGTKGYMFGGWYLDSNFTRKINSFTGVKSDITLYAKWTDMRYAAKPKITLVQSDGTEREVTDEARMETEDGIILTCETTNARIYYTLDDSDPRVNAMRFAYDGELSTVDLLEKIGKKGSQEDVAVTLRACAEGTGYAAGEVRVVKLTIAGGQDDWGDDITQQDREDAGLAAPEDVPDGFWLAGLPTGADGVPEVSYCGAAIRFDSLRVFYGKKLLKKGPDYTVAYTRNTNAYSYKPGDMRYSPAKAPLLTITGKGNYSEKFVQPFVINPVELDQIPDVSDLVLRPNGKVQKGVPVIKYTVNGKTLTLRNGKDFTCAYPNTDRSAAGYDPNAFKAVCEGKNFYDIVVTGIGNYTGTLHVAERITKGVSMSKLSFSVGNALFDNGKPVDPGKLTVKQGKTELRGFRIKLPATVSENGLSAQELRSAAKSALSDPSVTGNYDYVYYCRNNTRVGTAYITFYGVAEQGFEGLATKSYKVTGAFRISDVAVNGLESTYSWREQGADPFGDGSVRLQYDGRTLKEGTDYTLKYSGNVKKAGTVSVTIKGINQYTGTVTKKYTIAKCNLARELGTRISVGELPEIPYRKKSTKYDKGVIKIIDSQSGARRTLVEGTDFTVKYTKNTAVYTLKEGDTGYKASKAPTVTITGKGNYTGSIKRTFRITAGSLERVSIEARDVVYQQKANRVSLSKVVLTDVNGEKLVAGTDYDKKILYTYVDDTSVVCIPLLQEENRNGEDGSTLGDLVTDKDIIPKGTRIRATVTGKGKYAQSEKSVIFRFVERSIADAKCEIKDQIYTGKRIVLSRDSIYLTIDGEHVPANYYRIVGYRNNVARGTATVILEASDGSKYGGRKTAKFRIVRRPLLLQ